MLNALTYEDRLLYLYDDDPYKEPPDIFELFRFYNQAFFENKLFSSSIKWSQRMTLCAGTCKYEGFGSSTITLSEPLLKFRSNNELKETLIHEMIHAYWFATDPESCRVNEGHGPKFLEMMHSINQSSSLSISVYHKFHDEVDRCRQHIWKCDGPCQSASPFFGIVKRSMNRPPQPADNWFKRHQETCGGQFSKISEPEKIQKQQKQPKKKVIVPQKSKTAKTLDQYFFSPNLKTTTHSFIINLILTNDQITIKTYYETPKDFNYKELEQLLDKLYLNLEKQSQQIKLHRFDLQQQIQNKSNCLWKDIMYNSVSLDSQGTKLKILLEESDQEIKDVVLTFLQIEAPFELNQEQSTLVQINS